MGFKSLDQGRKGGFKPNCGEGVVLYDLLVVDSQELARDCQHFGTQHFPKRRYHVDDGKDYSCSVLSGCHAVVRHKSREEISAEDSNLCNGSDKARLGGL